MSEQRTIEADRDHWKAHAEEAGRGFERVCRDYARTAAAYSRLTREIEEMADRYAAEGAARDAAGKPAWPNNVARDLRALLATPPASDRAADGPDGADR